MAERPRRGGSVTLACTPGVVPEYIFPFTPVEYYTTTNLQEFQALLYRPLYWYGSGGQPGVDERRSLALPPQWSADGRTVTVTLKPWRWSDGSVVGADDVLRWMRLLEARKADFGGYVPGCFPDNLTGYRKVAEDRVAFTFDRVYSKRWVLMNQLSTVTPVPAAWDRTAEGPADCLSRPERAEEVWRYLRACNDDRAGWVESPVWGVVNGPWRLAGYGPQGLRFVPNDAYSGPDRPWLDEFRQVPSESNEAQYRRLEQGPHGPDAIQIGFLPPESVTEPTDDPTRGGPNPLAEHYRLVPQLTYKVNYFPVNFLNPTVAGAILRQPYLRQALQSVLDQDGAIRDVYHGYGYRTTGPVPLLPDSELISPRQRGNPFPFDVERARALLAEHGWDVSQTPAVCTDPALAGEGIEAGTRLSLVLRYAVGYPTLARIMEKLRTDAAAAGIELTLTTAEQRVIADEDTTGKPDWQLTNWNGGWIYGPGYHPTGEFLFRTGANMNFGSYADPETDELIDRTLAGDDLADFHAFQDRIAAQAPVIWMPNLPARLLEVDRRLRGVEPLNPYGPINPEDWYYADDHSSDN
ncbi:ABC transporter substrate-binding protein [Kitasatospora sp. LaBMicrA B282]|uniref:ABC transporter substrate-binding protein n=1 Tax=Kitasatospora sp. LaBMicrA B282 TaxID=3420949 RepID=UPI003D09C044